MNSASRFVIELLNRNHDRTAFNCGVESLNRYLRHQASQDTKRQISRVFVTRPPEEETKVLGFYTLSAFSIDVSALPEKIAKKLPKHPVPTALIGRLAVDLSAQGTGTGQMLLADAIKRTLAVGDDIAIYAMVVDAVDHEAESFYRRYGFDRLAHGGSRLFLPLRSLSDR